MTVSLLYSFLPSYSIRAAVVTILIVNINNLPPTQWQSLYQSAGLDTVSFAPSKSPLAASEWPTLGSE
jgi:hypothetical protein